jgi:hypothetical protein
MLRPCRCLVVLALAAWAGTAEGQDDSAEFTLDEQTLLLAHFNETAREADYAMGWKEFGGSGVGLTEGYSGRAIDLRGLQFEPDFLTTRSSRSPRFVWWGVWPRGNIDFRQGTYEFWFRVAPEDVRWNRPRQSLFFTHYYQVSRLSIASTVLTPRRMSWKWHSLSGDVLSGSVGFDPPLDPGEWHHYAMCWSPGEFVIYIDGRPVGAHDLSGKHGLLLAAQTHRDVAMNGVAMDELRISDVVRYSEDFEPRWREGVRPACAFAGAADVERFPPESEGPYRPAILPAPQRARTVRLEQGKLSFIFDRNTGLLTGFGADGRTARRNANGLLLWESVEREPLPATAATAWRPGRASLAFEQRFGDRVSLRHELSREDESTLWKVTFRNLTGRELWLEALMSLPVPLDSIGDYFDMSYVQDQLPLPRRRDEYVFSLPFVAAAGEGKAIGLGIDPHTDLSALISEWIPEGDTGTIRQGTRVVLDPRGEYSLEFRGFECPADFGVLDAIAHYHGLFPDLYEQDPAVPIYSYMPVCRYFEHISVPDLARLCYIGNQWGHGPGHCKGDEWGTERLWNLPKDPERPDHAYAARLERLWGSIEGLRAEMLKRSKRAYDTYYTLRRSHYLPNWAMRFVVEDIWPEGMIGGDPLVCGQYYEQMYYANEYGTPLGRHYKQTTASIMRHIGRYSPGFINDMCHTSPFRFTDDVARKTPGRAFSRDRGTYLVGAFGHADRYRTIKGFRDERGYRQSIWSDGGVVSYMLLAHSTAAAIESYITFEDFAGPELGLRAGRYMLGEKPYAVHYKNESAYFGRYFEPTDFTPRTLRDYFAYCRAQELLCALRHGVHVPYEMVQGDQALMELLPILVESIVLGRKIVPAARVREPLFVRRAGEGLGGFLVIGNEQPEPLPTDVVVTNRYFGGRPIFGAYFGGAVRHRADEETTWVESVTVAPRSMTALKVLGRLHGDARATVDSSFSGDGIRMSVSLQIDADGPAGLELSTFGPIYRVDQLRVNGRPSSYADGQTIRIPRGTCRVVVEYASPVLPFSRDDWDAVELLLDRTTNFCLITDTSSAFDSGTAGMLNDFVEQYDEEDGTLGNLPKADVYDAAPDASDGWKVFVESDADADPGRVRIDRAAREVHVEGRTPGEARRAMVVLLRLVDRKYPHTGRLFVLRRYGDEPWSKLAREETQDFFANFPDRQFLTKPILKPELEHLYAGGNVDFARKYSLRFSPYIFEPTYADDYVYGFAGDER